MGNKGSAGGSTSQACNWQCYLDRYPDVQKSSGATNVTGAAQHYSDYGQKEGRDCSCPCNWQCYLDRYADLQNTFGASNTTGAETHYNEYGKAEGRDCTCSQDAEDISKTTDTTDKAIPVPCINPANENAEEWACDCYEKWQATCDTKINAGQYAAYQSDADKKAQCFKEAWCNFDYENNFCPGHATCLCTQWKEDHCPDSVTAMASLLTGNHTASAQTDKTKKATSRPPSRFSASRFETLQGQALKHRMDGRLSQRSENSVDDSTGLKNKC